MSFNLGLSGRRALVTAGTKGVGAAVVEVLREYGANVVTTARSIPGSSLAGVHYVASNITTAEGCTLVAQTALDHLGGIDIVVNVLGGSEAPAGGFAALDDEAWRKEIDLNLMPAVRLDRALLPSMLAQGSGVIIHVTSIQHELPQDAYSLNNITAKKDADGSVTVQFGGCDGKAATCLPIFPGWSYMVRLYRPRKEVLNGTWKFPEAQPAGSFRKRGRRLCQNCVTCPPKARSNTVVYGDTSTHIDVAGSR